MEVFLQMPFMKLRKYHLFLACLPKQADLILSKIWLFSVTHCIPEFHLSVCSIQAAHCTLFSSFMRVGETTSFAIKCIIFLQGINLHFISQLSSLQGHLTIINGMMAKMGTTSRPKHKNLSSMSDAIVNVKCIPIKTVKLCLTETIFYTASIPNLKELKLNKT